MKVFPSLSMRTMIWSALGWGTALSTLGGTCTPYPIWVNGVATMKMMSITTTTSTSGVMLMSLLTQPLPSTLIAMIAYLDLLQLAFLFLSSFFFFSVTMPTRVMPAWLIVLISARAPV